MTNTKRKKDSYGIPHPTKRKQLDEEQRKFDTDLMNRQSRPKIFQQLSDRYQKLRGRGAFIEDD